MIQQVPGEAPEHRRNAIDLAVDQVLPSLFKAHAGDAGHNVEAKGIDPQLDLDDAVQLLKVLGRDTEGGKSKPVERGTP